MGKGFVLLILIGVLIVGFVGVGLVSAERVECWVDSITGTIPNSDPPAQCAGGSVDVNAKLTYAFDTWEIFDCSGRTLDIDGYFELWEKDATALDDDYLRSSPDISGTTYNCAQKTLTYTFNDLYLGSWATGDTGSYVELFVEGSGGSISGTSSCGGRSLEKDLKIIDGDCASGACCNVNTCYYKSSGSQPTGYTDEYFCSGDNSPTGTNYVKYRNYYCSGSSSSAQSSDSTQDTCGTCEYCTAGDSTCNYYSSSTPCGTQDCDNLDTSCRDYNDVGKHCSSGSCVSGSCNDYTNQPQHTSCGTGKECDGSGTCETCTSHSYTQCSDNDVYWYDACDNRQEKSRECGDDSCGGWFADTCKGNDVYETQTCYNRGCSEGGCDYSTYENERYLETCAWGCTSGHCNPNPNIVCYSNSDCGAYGPVGNPFCGTDGWPYYEGVLYQQYADYTCDNPGTEQSSCSTHYTAVAIENCQYGCSNGQCNNPPSCTDECTSGQKQCSGNSAQTCGNYDADSCLEWGNNLDCGTDSCGSWGANYCENNDVYHSRTCNDKGCLSGNCFNNPSTEEQIVQDCTNGCSNGNCISAGDLIAHWKFEDNIQDSADSHHGTNYGASFVAGKSGKAISFDGVNDYVSVPNNVDLNAKTDRSITAWIKRDRTGEGDDIMIKRGNSNSGWEFAVSSDNKLKFTFFGVKDIYSTEVITDTNWYHVAVTIDASGNVKFYIDGNNAGTGNINPALIKTTTQPLRMAAYVDSNGIIGSKKDFILDELKIWNKALTSGEVLTEYNSYAPIICSNNAECGTNGFTGEKYCAGIGLKDVYQNYQTFTCENPGTVSSSCSSSASPQLIQTCTSGCSNGECIDTTGLTAHWKFEDNIQDSADSHHGTNYGASFVAGKSGKAISFDGVNDYVSVPDNVDIRAKVPRSVEAWIKRDRIGEGDDIVIKRGNSNSGWGFAVSSDNKLKFTFFGVKDLYSTGTITDTNWHHVAVTIDAGGNVKFYIDGNAAGTGSVNPALIKTTAQPLRMAVYVDSNGIIGSKKDFILDELKIWNRVLSQDEIKAGM